MLKPKPKQLTPDEKARQVLCSQGRPVSLLGSLTPDETAELVAMHGAADLPERFSAWLDRYREARKATEEDEPVAPLPAEAVTDAAE